MVWESGSAYEAYVGRWSRQVAASFVSWIGVPPGRRWLDAGCGTGALTAAVTATAAPRSVIGIDPSLSFLTAARSATFTGPGSDSAAGRGSVSTGGPGSDSAAGRGSVSTGGAGRDSAAGRGSVSTGGPGRDSAAGRDGAFPSGPGRDSAAGRDGAFPSGPGRGDGGVPVSVCAGDAAALPLAGGSVDAVVSGLALNFVGRPEAAVHEFARVTVPGGVVAAYVWDYAGGMAMMREFWAAAAELDPASASLVESRRFGFCRDDVLAGWWARAGLRDVATRRIEIATVFTGFDDFWEPFLGGQGPAPAYLTSRTGAQRSALRDLLRSRLPVAADGSIALTAAAWAVRGLT